MYFIDRNSVYFHIRKILEYSDYLKITEILISPHHLEQYDMTQSY